MEFCAPDRITVRFENCRPMRAAHAQLTQIQNLRRTRDLLLPRLLSGASALSATYNTNTSAKDVGYTLAAADAA